MSLTIEITTMKNVLVTGSSRGIGLALVKQFLLKGFNVFASCRNPSSSPLLTAISSNRAAENPNFLRIIQMDTSSESSIKMCKEQIAKTSCKLDIIVNNAGIASSSHPNDSIALASEEDMLNVYKVNVIGPLMVSREFIPLLSEKGIIVNMSSTLGSIKGNTSGGIVSYKSSKAALNQVTKTFANAYPSKQFLMISPGWVQTDMGNSGGRTASLTPEESALAMVDVILKEMERGSSGRFIHYDSTELPF